MNSIKPKAFQEWQKSLLFIHKKKEKKTEMYRLKLATIKQENNSSKLLLPISSIGDHIKY